MKWEKEEKESPGATLYFGPELEVENIKNTCEPNALCILSDEYWRSARCKGQFYYKSDGSLSYGVELVGHPFSWEWFLAHRKNFEEWLALIQSKGFRSYSTSTCGLHIHMNKTAFSGQRLYKFMKFFHENGSFIYRMSGRKNRDDMDQWAAIDEEGAAKKNLAYEAKNKYKNKMGRYWAVNLEPERTIEIRIFKGTLNPGSFMRAFEFLRSLYLFTANGVVTIGNTTLQKYLRFAGELDEHDFRNLHQKLSLNRRFLDADVADGEEE
jgi:hypothetical protein